MRKVYLIVLFILFMLAPAVKAVDTGTATVVSGTLIIPIGEFSTSFTYAPVHVWQGETTVIINGTTIIEKIYPTLVSIYCITNGKTFSMTYSNGKTSIKFAVIQSDTVNWDYTITYTYTSKVSGTMTSIQASYWYTNFPEWDDWMCAVIELYYNNYGISRSTYIATYNVSHGESITDYMSAWFYKVFSFTNFSLTGNFIVYSTVRPLIMTYTINGTYYAAIYSTNDSHIFTIGTNTAILYFSPTQLYTGLIFTTLSAVKFDDFFIARSDFSYLISYGTLGEITITNNSVIYRTYTLVFSTTVTGYPQTQINMIILTKGTSGIESGFGMYPVILQLPSFQINGYSVSGSIIYVDGTLYYPESTDTTTIPSAGISYGLYTWYIPVYPTLYDILHHTWYPLGTRISYAITYIDLNNTAMPTPSNRNTMTNVITNTTTQEFISTYLTANNTVTRSETYLTYFSVKIPLEVDTIISSGQSITINDTYVLGPVTLSFSNATPLFNLTDVPTVKYNWTTTGHITTSTTVTAPLVQAIYIYDTLTTLPPYIMYYSTPGTYTTTKIYPVTYMDYDGRRLIYVVYTLEIIYRVEISYTPTKTSTSTAAANLAPFNITLSSVNDTEITGPVARTTATLLWFVEAALFGALLYHAYRYAAAVTEEERRKYWLRTLYVLVSMLMIYVLPRALDWIAGL